ncbi:MAG: hypothetical protein NT060_00275 [Candidatus Omnitrophica bacterium]|nr:hypothetical protein [Candidatus Omnitrophota bacterium]
MDKIFHIDILTPQETIYSGEGVSMVVPAQLGYLGILADHAPLVANILPGKITVREPSGNPREFAVMNKGILEVFSNNASILLDNA